MKTLEISRSHLWLAVAAIIVVAAGGVYAYWQLATATQATIKTLTSKLNEASTTQSSLQDALTKEQERTSSLLAELHSMSGTVTTLTKVTQTDPELLAKYSKVYFLSENYAPASLSTIPANYVSDETRTYQFLTQAILHLEEMIDAAQNDRVSLLVASAYRSFGTQEALKSNYRMVYGSGANAFSADQGYSEHQLGTAVDFTTKSLSGALDGFDSTDAYTWLTKNAYRYGFVLSYPKGNSYYQYEPWHWRYVGTTLATYLHDEDEHFYDLDQRTIDGYLSDFGD